MKVAITGYFDAFNKPMPFYFDIEQTDTVDDLKNKIKNAFEKNTLIFENKAHNLEIIEHLDNPNTKLNDLNLKNKELVIRVYTSQDIIGFDSILTIKKGTVKQTIFSREIDQID